MEGNFGRWPDLVCGLRGILLDFSFLYTLCLGPRNLVVCNVTTLGLVDIIGRKLSVGS